MSAYLLDINLLLALGDPMHIHHEPAHRWFAARGQRAWATCPLTENGFVRIASHANYPNSPGGVPVVLSMLKQLRGMESHRFWADDVSLLDVLEPAALISPAQTTDVYLLGLAIRHQGRLATLDRRIPAAAVAGGPQALEILET